MKLRTAFLCFLFVGLRGVMISIANGAYQDQYIGCFYGNPSTTFTTMFSNDGTSNIQKCIQHCQANTFLTYAVLKNDTLCSCGDEYGVQVSDDNCNLTCSPVGRETCRGVIRYPNAYALFSVCPIGIYGSSCENVCHCKRQAQCKRMIGTCPYGCDGNWTGDQCHSAKLSQQYIGCFADDGVNNRSMMDCAQCPPSPVDNSIESCTQKCSDRNQTYAGTQYRFQCFCGDTYARFGSLPETRCYLTCTSNENETCGGDWANSVYSVCPAGNYGNLCAGRCHCLNGGRCVYSNGSCLPSNTPCESGWKGSSCNIRDCGQNNGDCFSNETCYSITLNSATITACRCSEGYQRKNASGNCSDLDECSLSPPLCDSDSSTCNNTIDSFQCNCKDGYMQFSATSCSDIDECQGSLAQCDNASTICNNTRGGYECSCKLGYTRKDQYTCTDIDECTSEVCSKATTSNCRNTLGSGFSAGDMVGASIGSALGMAVIFGIVIIVVYLLRRRRCGVERTRVSSDTTQHQNQRKKEVSNLDSMDSYNKLTKKRANEEEAPYATINDIGSSSESPYQNTTSEHEIQEPPEDIITRCKSQFYEEVK